MESTAATAMETAPDGRAVKSTADRSAVKSAACIAAAESATAITRVNAATVATAVSSVAIPTTIAVTAAEAIPAVAITAAEPGTNPDKQPVDKVIRSIVAVRRARIRIVAVVSISASRRPIRRIPITADPDPNRNLSMRSRCSHGKRQSKNAKKCEIP
jgi:hypothetical protein